MERSEVTPQVAADTSDLADLAGAGIRVVPAGGGLEGGIGAIPRWST